MTILSLPIHLTPSYFLLVAAFIVSYKDVLRPGVKP